jgi:hypothetical protein
MEDLFIKGLLGLQILLLGILLAIVAAAVLCAIFGKGPAEFFCYGCRRVRPIDELKWYRPQLCKTCAESGCPHDPDLTFGERG